MATIAMIGTGYVGLVTGTCLSDFGNTVVCVDSDAGKVARLSALDIPLFEPGLPDLVARNLKAERLSFTTDLRSAVESASIVFIAVGTPSLPDGSADLSFVESAVRSVGAAMTEGKILVTKSTVPVGTGRLVRAWVEEELARRAVSFDFDVVSNPEFLREGSAVYDFMHPDRVVIGAGREGSFEAMKAIYRTLYLNETPFVFTDIETAEMIKYASNAFLALKIAFINETANLCEAIGANVRDLASAIGKDGRIGPKFLHPGPGYGGSCFPKDTRALASIGQRYGSPMTLIESVIAANERQKARMVEKVASRLGDLSGKTLAVLGLAFKQNTNDTRESPAIDIVRALIDRGARIKAYDPAAMDDAQSSLGAVEHRVTYCLSEYDALKEADAALILTEWNQFRNLDLSRARRLLKEPRIFDFRNIYESSSVEELGYEYVCVGN